MKHLPSFVDRPVGQRYGGALHNARKQAITAPSIDAPFAEKLGYYRTQHTSTGVNITHQVGLPFIVFGMPLLPAKPRLGHSMFAGGWALQIAGHTIFEKNMPSTHKDWIAYQLTGVVHNVEAYGEMLARLGERRLARAGLGPEAAGRGLERHVTVSA